MIICKRNTEYTIEIKIYCGYLLLLYFKKTEVVMFTFFMSVILLVICFAADYGFGPQHAVCVFKVYVNA